MRVISGTKKGYKLKGPKGKDTRPTEDRVKESLFNILRNIDAESRVLDLFAGSGSIGIEFLSRGAKKSYFIDKSYESIKCIKDNLEHLGFIEKAEVIKSDAIKIINMFKRKGIKFNYIFIDPPYGQHLILKTLEKICENDILEDIGIVIIEHEKDLILEDNIFNLIKTDYRNYGYKSLSFYTKK
ncbi:16S rRNA (guanine(966)-N(2))-methyltransferase RsmD [Clostridium sp. Cult2]|uniref:16S rRNA (guanine(966)-N(2))-methyltransferase RsmD n=1 Tax=Clostridium sp. Cult2 TaxID=2079003 RepID=UPI001F02452E|nr:16S rRNA (guanine(966)-N(2))-methyltransferase RsmD [Clostridium sp. Cult2]MCF6466418.1 16S rRNA (guanine(966)-N(2))-methyltransferase RsmD [Clostridium sp. Cult2]